MQSLNRSFFFYNYLFIVFNYIQRKKATSVTYRHILNGNLYLTCNGLFVCLFIFKITPSANDTEYQKVTIPLALMRYRDFLEARKVR